MIMYTKVNWIVVFETLQYLQYYYQCIIIIVSECCSPTLYDKRSAPIVMKIQNKENT